MSRRFYKITELVLKNEKKSLTKREFFSRLMCCKHKEEEAV